MPDRNISVHNFPDTSSSTTLPTSSYENASSTKTSLSDDELFEASLDFLRQHLKRKSESEFQGHPKHRKYSNTLLFEFDGNRKAKVKFLRLQNVDEFDKVLKLERSLPDRTLSAAELLPSVKKQRSNLSNLFNKSKRRSASSKTTTQSSIGFFNILRKLTPKSSKEDVKSKTKSDESITITSQSPTITSNSSFPSIVATIPSNLIIQAEFAKIEDNSSSFIVTNVWPPRNLKTTLTAIKESPRNSSLEENDEEDLKLNLTYKNDCCRVGKFDSSSDSEESELLVITKRLNKPKKISSKLSCCSEATLNSESSDYTDVTSTDSEAIDEDMLSSSEIVTSKLLDCGGKILVPQGKIQAIVNDLVTQLKERNISCAYKLNK